MIVLGVDGFYDSVTDLTGLYPAEYIALPKCKGLTKKHHALLQSILPVRRSRINLCFPPCPPFPLWFNIF
jgi:hypothetical protein